MPFDRGTNLLKIGWLFEGMDFNGSGFWAFGVGELESEGEFVGDGFSWGSGVNHIEVGFSLSKQVTNLDSWKALVFAYPLTLTAM